LALLIAGCASTSTPASLKEAESAQDLAFSCFMDVEVVPFERSGNCVEGTAALFELGECELPIFTSCGDFDRAARNTDALIHRAIANSLWNHGKPSSDYLEVAGLDEKADLRNAYRSPSALRDMYAHCLTIEEELQKSAFKSAHGPKFQQVTSIYHPNLGEDELCYRAGYEAEVLVDA
jgi:hypothetical protein